MNERSAHASKSCRVTGQPDASAKRYTMLENHELAETVTAAERAENAEITRERSGTRAAVRGAGQPAGEARTPVLNNQSREPEAARAHGRNTADVGPNPAATQVPRQNMKTTRPKQLGRT